MTEGTITEYRIPLPMEVNEAHLASLYTVCMTSLQETGGGEGVEVIVQEPRENPENGQMAFYYEKLIHLRQKLPNFMRVLLPSGAAEVFQRTYNGFPAVHTGYDNAYMKDAFYHIVTTKFVDDKGEQENVFDLPAEKLAKRNVVHVDIVNDPVDPQDYTEATDPKKVHLESVDRGPLTADWKDGSQSPVSCCYRLVETKFMWFGLQAKVEQLIKKFTIRSDMNFYRAMYCNLDKTYGMTLDDIRKLEEETTEKLNRARQTGEVTGMVEK